MSPSNLESGNSVSKDKMIEVPDSVVEVPMTDKMLEEIYGLVRHEDGKLEKISDIRDEVLRVFPELTQDMVS